MPNNRNNTLRLDPHEHKRLSPHEYRQFQARLRNPLERKDACLRNVLDLANMFVSPVVDPRVEVDERFSRR